MSEYDAFDEAAGDSYQKPQGPIWQYNLDSDADSEIHRWLVQEKNYLVKEAEDRVRLARRNLALYKGIQYQALETRLDGRDRGSDRSTFIRKIVANHLFDLTKNRASRLIKYRPAVAVLPTNDEFEDKIAAKMSKYLLDHIWYCEDFEGKIQLQLATYAMVMGEVYLFILWDKTKGDLNPAYVEAAKKHKGKVPLLDENGAQVEDNGKPVYVDRPIRVGDVEYRLMLCDQVYLQRKNSLKDVDYCITKEAISTDLLRLRYPDKAGKIKDRDVQIYDYERMEERPARRECYVYTFWHKRSEQMDKGRKIVFTDDCILENTIFPFSHRKLPFERFTDVEFPGELHAKSFYETIKPLTSAYNNLTNIVMRNLLLVSHPKWMVPAGSVALDRLGNDVTIVQYKGPTPPSLAVAQTTPAEVYSFRDKLKEEFQQISGVFGVSRGEPPPGIKAGVALQFLSEQESERYNELVLKWNELIKAIAQMTLAVAGDYYDESDERMVRVIGKNNEYMTEFFDVSALEKDYDVRVQNSSALPRSVAARTQTLLDLNERFPDQFTGEQIIDMLELAQSDKFTDAATVAVRAAEAETERLLDQSDSDPVGLEPKEYENHIIHWRIHTRQIQQYSYKFGTPEKQQKQLEDHILAHEMFMVEKAQTNPLFAKKLEALDLFPMFYKLPQPPLPSQEQQPMPAQAPMAAPVPSEQMQPQPFQPTPGLPANPLVGGEPQMDVAEGLPPVEAQMGVSPPIQPTSGV